MLMTPDLLVCPGCRTVDGCEASGARRLDVKTLERSGDVLACTCGRRYPIIDGVPVVMSETFLRDSMLNLVERDLPLPVAALLVEAGPDGAPYPHLVEHLSVYLDAHWGDRASPREEAGLAPFIAKIAALPRVAAAVELGCSVGRIVAELQADYVVGIDVMFPAVRRARHLLAGESLAYLRRGIGRHYSPATIQTPARSATLLCADALDPPLLPRMFDRVVALNVLDSLRDPHQLLAVLDGLCAPGGELVLSSPYAWKTSVTGDAERFGGERPAEAMIAHLRDTGYQIADEDEIRWELRRDARSTVVYRSHYVRAINRR